MDVEYAPEVYRYSLCGRFMIDSGIGMGSVEKNFYFKRRLLHRAGNCILAKFLVNASEVTAFGADLYH